jgi:hypothetical protein
MPRVTTLVLAGLLPFGLDGAEASGWIAPNEVSLGAVRVTDDWFRQRGLPDNETGTLIAWMHDAGTLNDANLRRATLAIVSMLDQGPVNRVGMRTLCAVAPKCIQYMAEASALTEKQMQLALNRRNLEARSALRNMFVVAALDHIGKNEMAIVREARELTAR